MIRAVFLLCGLGLLTACGQGSQYSSQRAQMAQPTYVPVSGGQLTGPVAITPGAQPILTEPVSATPDAPPPVTAARLEGPVAITPGAVPVTDAEPLQLASASAPAASLKPPARAMATAAAPAPQTKPVRVASKATPPARVQRAVVRHARGPIYSACVKSGRKAASDARCGCVQWVADKELSSAQQRRGAGYFSNKQKLQDVRQSDSASNEAFWTAWKAYGQSAARQCKGT